MNIGLSGILTAGSIDVADLAPRAEALGFESIWTGEQPSLPVETETPIPREWGDIPDPFVLLSRAAAVTTTLRLGTAVCVVTVRHPISIAKAAASLDMYSSGRFLLGIGTGSIREESDIFGVDFDHRWTQAREAVAAMKELWTKDRSEFHGKYYDFPPVYCYPKPVQSPHPPILLGSHVPQVFKRIVDYADGWLPIEVSPERVADARARLDSLAEAAGRDPRSIEITAFGVPDDPDVIRRYELAGADRVVLNFPTASTSESIATLERMASSILSK